MPNYKQPNHQRSVGSDSGGTSDSCCPPPGRLNAGDRIVRSEEWIEHFRSNQWDPDNVVDHKHVELSRRSRRAIAKSLQTFQLGESGEGKHFLNVARKWAAETGDHEYVKALELFIAAEQRHAAALGAFMDRARIPRIQKEVTDNLFRWLRHQAGLELTVTVLITAEIIARVYYPALRRATSSHWLRKICEQISRDEVAHIRFQGQRLGMILRRKNWFSRACSRVLSQMLFDATCVGIWFAHRRVFKSAKLSWREYWNKCTAEYMAARRQIGIGLGTARDVAPAEPRWVGSFPGVLAAQAHRWD